MNLDEALGWMAVTVLNEHFPSPELPEEWVDPEAPELGTAGCVKSCGPCGALAGLDTTDRFELELRIMLTGFHAGGWSWWSEGTGRLRWDVLEAYWAGHKGCSSVNGAVEPCTGESL